MNVNESYAVCNCRNCHGARKVSAITITGHTEAERDRLEALLGQLKQGWTPYTAEDFRFALERANWELDFPDFCRLLGLPENEQDQRSMEMWDTFHALAHTLGEFGGDNLGKLIEFGLSLKNVAEGGQLVISMQ